MLSFFTIYIQLYFINLNRVLTQLIAIQILFSLISIIITFYVLISDKSHLIISQLMKITIN